MFLYLQGFIFFGGIAYKPPHFTFGFSPVKIKIRMQSANELHFCNEIICALFSDKRENGLKNLLKFAYSFGFFNLFFSLMFFGAEFAKSFDLFFSFYKLNDIGGIF